MLDLELEDIAGEFVTPVECAQIMGIPTQRVHFMMKHRALVTRMVGSVVLVRPGAPLDAA
jgi:hypothetical protein